jgi:TonB family protein
MKRFSLLSVFVLIAALFVCNVSFSQTKSSTKSTSKTKTTKTIKKKHSNKKKKNDDNVILINYYEESASFPGGIDSLNKFIEANLQYPEQARQCFVQGTVYLTFTVEKDGSLTDIKVIRDIGCGCGEEAIRIIKMMPKWIPGKQSGKIVRQLYNLPIKFILDSNTKQ